HLLGSSSVVTSIRYAKGSVTYSTFDSASDDALRLDFVPKFVTAGGRPMEIRKDLNAPGYTFDETTRVLRIRHDDARDIDIQGEAGSPSLRVITFDDPHLPAGTVLRGAYPAGAIEWGAVESGEAQWKIHGPAGKFGTFNLALADPKET